MSTLIFHRPPRVAPPELPTEPVVLAAPPQPVGKDNSSNWLILLMPLLSSMSMAAYLMSNGRRLLVMLGVLFVVVSITVTVLVRMQMRGAARRQKLRGRDLYLDHLVQVRLTARQTAEAQRTVAGWAYPSPYRLWAITRERRRVWERRRKDPDFLHVCVGVGTGRLTTPIRLATRNDPTVEYDERAKASADRLIEAMSTVGSQPAVVDLARAGVVSVLGPAEVAGGTVRAMLCQIAVLHAPDDVGVAIMTGGEDWQWTKWLPHVHEPDSDDAESLVPLVAEEFEGIADHLREVLDAAARQAAARKTLLSAEREAHSSRRLVVVLDRYDPHTAWARSPLAAELLEMAGPSSGITVICLVEQENDEPTRADVRVRVDGGGSLSVEDRRPSGPDVVQDVLADWPEPRLCEQIARSLAPLRLSVEGEEILAQTVTLPSMLGVGDLESFVPEKLWVEAEDEQVLRMPIGVDGSGQPLVLDLKESAQGGMGPHGLIVGATGSGKSELLRTLVTGLTMTHSPELLSMVLVDFKGGATFAGVTELPHVAGLITNLIDDLAMVDRVRDALMGEQQRRQRMLRDAGNLDTARDYQLRRAAGGTGPDGRPLEPMPYLLIIVDEFGELLSSRPDFIDLFVQIGRVGRSLGMHLLLATQRLEEGRLRGLDANLSYRICLRTFSAAESRTVIGSPDAYRLPAIPGSAYLKVTDTDAERFRVAHVSGPHQPVPAAERRPSLPAAPVVFTGLRTPPDPYAAPAEPEPRLRPQLAGPTQMQVIVERLRASGQAAHQVWLPPLPAAVALDNLTGPLASTDHGLSAEWWPEKGGLRFPLGVLDVPVQQLQQPLVPDFAGEHGNMMLVGAPQSGKSTFLRTLMMSAMLTHTPRELQFACLDFGGGTLLPYERAPHVTGVAGRHDLPRARRVLAEARKLIAEREALFRHLGIDSVAAFRRMRKDGKLPPDLRAADLFLLIDNWAAVRAEFEDIDSFMVDVATRGLGVGVHLLITANRWGDVRMALRDSISARLELRLNDPSESEVNRRVARFFAAVPPGRGLAPPGVQYQVALPRLDSEDTVDGLGEAQSEAIDRIARAWEGPVAPRVRMLPEKITVAEMSRSLPAGDLRAGVPIGVGENDLEPVFAEQTPGEPHFLVYGDSGSGKSVFLRTWMNGLMARRSAWEARFIVVDYRRSLLGAVPPDYLGAYAGDANAARVYIEQVAAKLAERLPPPDVTVEQLRDRSWWQGPEFYLVVDDFDLVAGSRQSPLDPLIDYLPQATEIGLHVVAARRVAGLMRSQMSELVLARVRELGAAGLVLSGDPREGVVLGDQRAEQRAPGRGVLVRRQHAPLVVQVAMDE